MRERQRKRKRERDKGQMILTHLALRLFINCNIWLESVHNDVKNVVSI